MTSASHPAHHPMHQFVADRQQRYLASAQRARLVRLGRQAGSTPGPLGATPTPAPLGQTRGRPALRLVGSIEPRPTA